MITYLIDSYSSDDREQTVGIESVHFVPRLESDVAKFDIINIITD
jgi:hypothetical protein